MDENVYNTHAGIVMLCIVYKELVHRTQCDNSVAFKKYTQKKQGFIVR